MISAIGEVYSEDSVRLFTTSPLPRAAESLNISLASVGKRSAKLSWSPASDLPCVSLYNISLCREQPHRGCVQHYRCEHLPRNLFSKIFFFSVTVDESTTTLFAANNSLTECTNYYLKILPIHESRKIGEKIVPFQTQFPPLTNLTRQLGGRSEVSQAANQKAILDSLDQ